MSLFFFFFYFDLMSTCWYNSVELQLFFFFLFFLQASLEAHRIEYFASISQCVNLVKAILNHAKALYEHQKVTINIPYQSFSSAIAGFRVIKKCAD